MTNQHRLHLFAFDVTHPPVPDQPVYGLRFSPSWREMIWPGRSEGCHVKTPGLASLREELMQLYPGLLCTRFDESALAGKTPALVAEQPIPADVLAWHFTRHFKRIGKSASFDASDVEWSRIDWAKVDHQQDAIFSWLPAYVSRRFAESAKPFRVMEYKRKTKQQVFEGELRFYPVFLNGKYGCMTEPYKGYSYAVYFSVETRANQPGRKFLYIHPRIHRFVSVSVKRGLSPKRNGTVLIRLPHRQGKTPFVPVTITKSSKQGVAAEWKEDWIPEYLNYFLPEPLELESLLSEPSRYQNVEGEICALLLYNPVFYSSYYNEKVAKGGMGLSERKQLFDLFQEVFPELEPLQPLKEVKTKRIVKKKFPMTVTDSEESRLRINCHTTDPVFQNLVEQIEGLTDYFSRQDNCVYKLRASGPEMVVELRHCPDSGVVQDVDINHPHRTLRRMKTMITKWGKAHGALVMIEPKKTWSENPKADPKHALRVAFAECGQITQFLHDDNEENFEHRVKNAFFDLLSDFGVYTHHLIEGVDRERVWLFVTAFRPHKLNEGRVLYARYDGDRYLIRMEGDDGSWRALPEFITDAGGLKQGLERDGLTREKQPEIERTILQILQETERPLTVVFDRIPLTKLYYPVQDKHLINGDWILTRPELDYQRNRLRILRITTGDQVPDYYNDEYGKAYSYRSGLFLSEDGVYYSLGQKPKTYRGAVLLTKATDPSELLLQPNLVEILPVGHWDPGEVEEAVRQLHMLRKANLTYDHHTIYPAPLHRLNAAKKYLEAFLTVQRSVKNDRVRI